MEIDEFYSNKHFPDRKTFKIKLKLIIKDHKIKKKIINKVNEVNELQFIVYHFIRSYILYCYKNNDELPSLNKDFIMSSFRVFMKKNAGPKQKNIVLGNKLTNFYRNEFLKKFRANKFEFKNVSYILQECATEMEISYKNNIVCNFYKYLNQFINQNFKNDLNELLNKEKNKKKHSEIKKNFYKDLRKLKDSLMLNDENMCPKIYSEWVRLNKNKILPKLDKENHLKQLKYYPHKYLKHMLYMNSILEQKNLKMFQAICLRTDVKNKFITINTNALVDILIVRQKNDYFKNIRQYADKLWSKVLDKNKFTYNNYSFNDTISTDGYVVCINLIYNDKIKIKNDKINAMKLASDKAKKKYKNLSFEQTEKLKNDKYDKKVNDILNYKPIKEKKILTEKEKLINKLNKNEFQYVGDLIKNDCFKKHLKNQLDKKKLVYGDPGKRDIIKFYGENGKQFRYSSKRRVKELKRYKTIELIDSKKSKTLLNINGKPTTVKIVEKELTQYNSKTIDYNKFMEYCEIKFQFRQQIMNEINYNNYLLKHQWFSHINKMRHESKIINEIRECYGNDALFIIGDCLYSYCRRLRRNAKNKLPYISTPGIGFKKLMAKNFKVNIIDEYNTSKINFKTFEENKKLTVNYKKDNKIEKINLYSVFTYKMENGRYGCINRDLNSVYNMKTIVSSLINTNKRPTQFIRKKKRILRNRKKTGEIPSNSKKPLVHIG